MSRWLSKIPALIALIAFALPTKLEAGDSNHRATPLRAGFSAVDITPECDEDHPVYLAGYLPGRQATGVHDPLYARCVVLSDGERRVALVTVDLIGLQHHVVQDIRRQVEGFDSVTVVSSHNHSGPDVIGIWGKSFLKSGVDQAYLTRVKQAVVESIRQARASLQAVRGQFGMARDDSLLADVRLPVVKDARIRVLKLNRVDTEKTAGIVVQWDCHPEALRSDNTLITADFPAKVIEALSKRYGCPVLMFAGALGGLIVPPLELNMHGERWARGTWEFANLYGQRVAALAVRAIDAARTIQLAPIRATHRVVYIPVRNPWYRAARLTGVVRRDSYQWTGDPFRRGPPMRLLHATRLGAIESEVGYWQLGDLGIAMLPGELFPELLEGRVTAPEGADNPNAPLEIPVTESVPAKYSMLAGLANDEVGYLIPARQWDVRAPFAFGRRLSQYGEINSCGADAARVVLDALRLCCQGHGPELAK